jgi:hypothetical protein
MNESIGQALPLPAPERWWRRFGWRNWAYLAFVILLVPFGIALEASGPSGPDHGGGLAAALIIGGIGTGLFFLVNLVLLIVALAKNRPAGKPAIACALPIAIILGTFLLEELTVS